MSHALIKFPYSRSPTARRRSSLTAAVCMLSFVGCRDTTRPPPPTQYTLTVYVAGGVLSNPPEGTHTYSVGTRVAYAFGPRVGHENIRVSLDGSALPAAGTITMDANHALLATADSIVVVASADVPLVTSLRSMLTDPSPMPAFQAAREHMIVAFQGAEAAEVQNRIRAALITAYDPVEDAPALRRVLREIQDSLSSGPQGAPPMGVKAANNVSGSGSAAIVFLYMNGIQTWPDEARITREKFLQPVIAAAGFGDSPVYEVYNKTAAKTDALEEVWICLNIKADLFLSGRFSAGADLDECFTRLASGLWKGDYLESAHQLVNTIFTLSNLPERAQNDAVRLAKQIADELATTGRVIVVAHSQGNLMLAEALQYVSATLPNADLRCVGVVGIAPPAPVLHPQPEQMIIRGTRAKDILAQFLPTTADIRDVQNDLSDAFDRALSGAPLFLPTVRQTILNQGVALHKINSSYLGESRTKFEIIAALKIQANKILSECPGALAVTTLPASDISSDLAVLNGSVIPAGSPTSAWFEWGNDPSLSMFNPSFPYSVGSGTTAVPVQVALGGWLAAGTTYYFRAAASNNSGITKGEILSFTTALGGNLEVTTLTTGQAIDPDGYWVAVGRSYGSEGRFIGINATTTFRSVEVGDHVVDLGGLATNCRLVEGQNPRTVTVPAGGTAQTTFSVNCEGPGPTTGNLQVTTSTTGQNLDSDGYVVTVDGGQNQAIGINGSATFTGLSAGSHTVVLSGVAGNCTVSDGTARTVTVPSTDTATVPYSISCTAAGTGDLTVTTSTTGSSVDPDGYTATVDGSNSRAIGINANVTFTGLSAGAHAVVLSGVAGNCTVSGGTSQTVAVPAGGTAQTPFTITCQALLPPATDVTGQWAGERSDNSTLGDLALFLRQDGARVTGEFQWLDSPSGDAAMGTIEGLVSEKVFSGHMSGSYILTECKLEIDFRGSVDDFSPLPGDDRIVGTYQGTNSCTGTIMNGAFQVFRTL